MRRAFGPTVAAFLARARALQLDLCARGFVSSLHVHDSLSGLELFYFSPDVAMEREVEQRDLGRLS